MPTYLFHHEDSDETIEVYLDLNQPREAYHQHERGGKVYKRIYTVPLAGINTRPGDADFRDYKRRTTDKNLTLDEMTKVSKEMSEKRAAREGIDGVKETHYKRYEENIGRPHKDVVKREKRAKAEASLKKFGVKVDMGKS